MIGTVSVAPHSGQAGGSTCFGFESPLMGPLLAWRIALGA